MADESSVPLVTAGALGSLVRHTLGGLGVYVASRGTIDAGTAELIVGVLMAVGAFLWGQWQQRRARLALVIAAGSPMRADAAIVRAAEKPIV